MSQDAQAELITAWLAEHAIPLRTVEPGNGVDDLKPLAEVLDGVRVVGLGRPRTAAGSSSRSSTGWSSSW